MVCGVVNRDQQPKGCLLTRFDMTLSSRFIILEPLLHLLETPIESKEIVPGEASTSAPHHTNIPPHRYLIT